MKNEIKRYLEDIAKTLLNLFVILVWVAILIAIQAALGKGS